MLYLNGVPSSDVGLVVEHRPARPIPKRKTLSWDIPGRSGKLIRTLDAWENVTLTYELALVPPQDVSLNDATDAAVSWLMQPDQIQLFDDADPNVFYRVVYAGGDDLSAILHSARRVKVRFTAEPQRWLMSGQLSTTLSASGSKITNPTQYLSKPLVVVGGSGSGSLSFGDRTISFNDCQYLILDSEVCSATRPAFGNWPELPAGDTTVTWTGGVTGVEVYPRWYVI